MKNIFLVILLYFINLNTLLAGVNGNNYLKNVCGPVYNNPKDINLENLRNINNIYGKWRVKGCRIIYFTQDEEDLSFHHQVKVSKQKEQKACLPYIGKEMTITKELLDFDFVKCPVGHRCKIHKENPKYKLEELHLDDKSLPWRYEGQYMLQNQQKIKLQWMVLMDDWEPGDACEEDYYTFVINYTIFTNYLEIVNFYMGDQLYLVLEKVE